MRKRYVIVYQMGKVASTSVSETLNEVDGIEAVQSHFLGEQALASIIPSITGADVSPYFFKHQLGQFIDNVRITRRMNRARAGKTPMERLLMISLTRNPIEWGRSSVVQDIQGYLPILKSIVQEQGIEVSSDLKAVEDGLKIVLGATCNLIERSNGIDAFLKDWNNLENPFKDTIFQNDPGAKRLLFMLLRPADWFDKHFEVSVGVRVANMKQNEGVLEFSDRNADYVIVKYETMEADLLAFLRRNKICDIEKFKRTNTSERKAFAKEVAASFKSPEGQRLKRLFSATKYSQVFNYS